MSLLIKPTLWESLLAPSMVFGNPLSQVLRTSLNLSEHAWKSGSNLHTKAVVVVEVTQDSQFKTTTRLGLAVVVALFPLHCEESGTKVHLYYSALQKN